MKRMIALVLAAVCLLVCVSACSASETKEVDLSAVMAEIEEKVSLNADEMQEITKDELNIYYGINTEDVKQVAAKINSTGIKADEIVMIEAVDADAAQRIKEKLDARYESKKSETISYLPDEYAVIEKCSVEMTGNYVTMLISPDAATMTEIFQNAIK